MWEVSFTGRAEKDLARLSSADRQRVLKFLDRKIRVADNIRAYGEALTGPLAGHWKFRIGDLRIIAALIDRTLTVEVVRIGQRGSVYRR